MKNHIKNYLYLIILLFSITSCKKEIVSDPAQSLIGKWHIKSYVITNFENGGKDIDDTKGQFPRPTFEFDKTGTFTSTLDPPYVHIIGYTVNADKVLFTEKIAFDHKDFKFNITGSTLLLTRSQTYTTTKATHTENTTVTLERL